MKLYTSDLSSYEGMDEETVVRLRFELGRITEFISQMEYEELIEVKNAQPKPTPALDPILIRLTLLETKVAELEK